jgi:hypothetical protein
MKREFTGVFIPAHIWTSKELIPAEKMILGEIDALSKTRGYCDASRAHFAEWLGCTVQNVTYYFEKLQRLGFISVEKIPGYRSKIALIQSRFYEDQGVNGTDGGGKPGLRVGVNGTDWGGKRDLPEIKEEIKVKIKEKEKVSAHADLFPKKSLEPIDEAFAPVEALSKKRKSTPGAEKEKKVEALPALDFSKFDNPEKAKEIFTRWLKYRKDIKHPYKSEDTIQTSLKNLLTYSAGRAALAEQIIEKSIGNGYQGFFKPEIQKNGNSTIQPENRFNSAETIASAQRVAESMREYWQ